MNHESILLNTDSYKISHFKQYEPGTTHVYSYIESRGGVYDELVFFGIQAFIKSQLMTPITAEDVNTAEIISLHHGFKDFNRKMWDRIVDVHGGKLPLRIKAAPEGMRIGTKKVLVTVENTDPECFALTSYIETPMLRAIWYPTTVATNSKEIIKLIYKSLQMTADDPDAEIAFKLQDFGARGVSSRESAGLGGLAHLLNARGTDTLEALLTASKYYNVDLLDTKQMPGFSIPAAEHSTITSWGRDQETEAFRNMIVQFAGVGNNYAVVSDSFNIFNAVNNLWGRELKQEVIDAGGTLIVRPDSGNPVTMPFDCMQMLEKHYGTKLNSKGYKVLPDCVRIIQGDGIGIKEVAEILHMFNKNGYSTSNIGFGMGGGLLSAPQRDDQKFAMKCSSMRINGHARDVYKDPVSDGSKASKRGRVTTFYSGVEGVLVSGIEGDMPIESEVLRTVFLNGDLLIDEHFETIRLRNK